MSLVASFSWFIGVASQESYKTMIATYSATQSERLIIRTTGKW